jgi:hypothetical protein
MKALRAHKDHLRSLHFFTDLLIRDEVIDAMLELVASSRVTSFYARLIVPKQYESRNFQKYLPETIQRYRTQCQTCWPDKNTRLLIIHMADKE